MNTLPITEADLHAYVDGLLPVARRVEIEAYLAARPDEAARLDTYRAQNAALHALFDPVLDEPIPGRLTATQQRGYGMLQRVAAGIAIAFFSGSIGWVLHGARDTDMHVAQNSPATLQQESGLAHQAAIAHVVYSPDVRHPVEIGADQEDQLVTWLSKRLGTPMHPPRLGKLGFELIGGRLLPGETGPVAQFMYHDAAGQRLTLYVSTDQAKNKDTGFRFAEQGPVNVFYWIDGKFGYALSAGINKSELAKIATAVYDQLEKS
jgi:anti-sigma factor RsiW